jgi:hypothetical protein
VRVIFTAGAFCRFRQDGLGGELGDASADEKMTAFVELESGPASAGVVAELDEPGRNTVKIRRWPEPNFLKDFRSP